MSARTHTSSELSTQADEVVSWRFQQLRACGFEPELAEAIAHDCGYDLHGLAELVGSGCAPDLAARILAPLGDGARPC